MEPYSRSGLNFKNPIILSITVLIAVMLFSCENDITLVNEITRKDTLPVMTSYNIEIQYSEKGKPQFNLKAPVATVSMGEDACQEFPEGFHITFYDSLMNIKSELSADYGISIESTKIMEARRNVVVLNHERGEKMNTEFMTWDQNKKIIFSDAFVKITTPTDVLYGKNGFEADESFNSWVIRKTSGEFEISDDNESPKP